MRAAIGIGYYCWMLRRGILVKLLTLAIALSSLAAFAALVPIRGREVFGPLAALFAAVTWPSVFVIFATPTERKPDHFGGFPRPLLCLPVPTRTLVLWPMLFGFATPAVLWLSAAGFINWIGLLGVPLPLWMPALTLAALIASVQVAAWTPAPDPTVRLYLLLFAIVGPFGGLFVLVELLGWMVRLPEFSIRALVGALLAGWLCVCVRVAMAEVESARRGDNWIPELPEWATAGWRPRRGSFADQSAAQVWFLQANPHVLSSIVFSIAETTLFGAAALLFLDANAADNRHLLLPILVGAAPLVLAVPFMSGSGRFKSADGRRADTLDLSGDREQLRLLLCRPVRSSSLAANGFRTLLVFVPRYWLALSGTALILLVLLAIPYFMGKVDVRPSVQFISAVLRPFPGVQGLLLVGLALAMISGVSWKLSTDALLMALARLESRRLCLAAAAGVAAVQGLLAACISLSFDPPSFAECAHVLAPVAVAVIVLKLGVAAVAFRAAAKRHLLDDVIRPPAVTLWVAFAVSAVSLVALLASKAAEPLPVGVLYLVVFAALPLGRFALVPLLVERVRRQ